MPTRYEVGRLSEIEEPGSRLLAEVKGVEVAIFNHDGEFYALANFCPHQIGPLCEGPLVGRTVVDQGEWLYDDDERFVVCPWHGWMFDITTGVNVDADRYRVPTYDVEVSDGKVYVIS